MKKNIALIISIVALILLVVFLRVNIVKEYNGPIGEKISDGIYAYDLQTDGLSVNGLTTQNEELYYLLMEELDPEKGLYSYQLKKLDIHVSALIIGWLEKNIEGCENPRIHGKGLVENKSGQWRYRIGDYRVICEIQDKEIIVLVLEIGHRRDIYDK